jgi:hypothetical protein
MSDYNDNLLKQKGFNIKTFKAKRPIGWKHLNHL